MFGSFGKIRRLASRLALASILMASASIPALADGNVTLYTTREPGLIKPLLDAFSEQTSITVDAVFVKDGLLERVKAEGSNSPADVLMTVDFGNLIDLVGADLTQAIDSAALKEAIPAQLRDEGNQWFALSMRARVLYAEKDLELDHFHYEDLADPQWKGKVCIRAGQHPYNTALIAAMIAHEGAENTEKWLSGVKDNLARKAAGGDRDVARDILGGICEIGLANSYYVGRMKASEEGSEARQWGDAIKVIKPHFEEGGTHVNISGAAVARNAPNKEQAVKLLEYLVSPEAQALYARVNYEYPVREGVEIDEIINETIGAIRVDTLPLTEIYKHRKQASELVDKVGFDQ